MRRRWVPVSGLRTVRSSVCSYGHSSDGTGDNVVGRSEAADMAEAWEDGSGGFQWKERHLAERRAVALDYMGNVARRVPIHDAVRIRSRLGRDRLLKDFSDPAPLVQFDPESEVWRSVNSYGAPKLPEEDGASDDGLQALEALLSEEAVDSLAQLTDEELGMLRDEFYAQPAGDLDGEEADDRMRRMLQEWYRLRKDSSQYDAYCAVPANERSAWSAWYLRDVRARPSRDDDSKPL
jgi:hypothetical protein